MKCPRCRSTQVSKNGYRREKQSYLCKACGRQFIESYSSRGYSEDAKQICLNMYQNGVGLRAIERITGISHNTVGNWVRQAELMLDQFSNTDELDQDSDG
jgi:transposase-like protein